MQKTMVPCLMVWVGSGMLVGQAAPKKVAARHTGVSVADQMKRLERDWTEAQRTGDTNRLNIILADDWVGVGVNGTKTTKAEYLSSYKARDSQFDSVEVGDLDIVVIGNVAIVQGSDKEQSTYKGKDSSGKYVWMDVFEKKDGKWQAVRSALTKTS